MERNFTIDDVTFVIIGKNESKIIERSFNSVHAITHRVIYVDSNSSDTSVEISKKNNVGTVIGHKLNWATAAHSRNLGANLVRTKLIHFLDGDETVETGWIEAALKFLNSHPNVAVVHGFKKVFTEDFTTFTILKDKKNWEPDYLQGACLVVKQDFDAVGGFDNRLFGEEERDFYVKLHASGKKNWYVDELMASHFDFKKRSIWQLVTSPNNAGKIIPLINALRNGHLMSYIFVYRNILACLALELFPMLFLQFGYLSIVLMLMISQCMLYFFVIRINRRGYFIFWKGLFLRIDQIPKLIKRRLPVEFVRYV